MRPTMSLQKRGLFPGKKQQEVGIPVLQQLFDSRPFFYYSSRGPFCCLASTAQVTIRSFYIWGDDLTGSHTIFDSTHLIYSTRGLRMACPQFLFF